MFEIINYIYFNGSNSEYNLYVSIGIAILTFYHITMAIVGLIKVKKIMLLEELYLEY